MSYLFDDEDEDDDKASSGKCKPSWDPWGASNKKTNLFDDEDVEDDNKSLGECNLSWDASEKLDEKSNMFDDEDRDDDKKDENADLSETEVVDDWESLICDSPTITPSFPTPKKRDIEAYKAEVRSKLKRASQIFPSTCKSTITTCKVPNKSNLKKVPQTFRTTGHHAIDTKVSDVYLTIDAIGMETYFQTLKDQIHSVHLPINRIFVGSLVPSINLNSTIVTMFETFERFFAPDKDILFYLLSFSVIFDLNSNIYNILKQCFRYYANPDGIHFEEEMEFYPFGEDKPTYDLVTFRLFDQAERLIFLNIIIILLLVFGAGEGFQNLETVRTVLRSFAKETRANMKKDFEETYKDATF